MDSQLNLLMIPYIKTQNNTVHMFIKKALMKISISYYWHHHEEEKRGYLRFLRIIILWWVTIETIAQIADMNVRDLYQGIIWLVLPHEFGSTGISHLFQSGTGSAIKSNKSYWFWFWIKIINGFKRILIILLMIQDY